MQHQCPRSTTTTCSSWVVVNLGHRHNTFILFPNTEQYHSNDWGMLPNAVQYPEVLLGNVYKHYAISYWECFRTLFNVMKLFHCVVKRTLTQHQCPRLTAINCNYKYALQDPFLITSFLQHEEVINLWQLLSIICHWNKFLKNSPNIININQTRQ